MHGNSQNVSPAATGARNQPQPPQPYYVRHEFGGSSELATTLAHALSDVTGADVTEAEAGLGDHLDLDALNRLFESASEEVHYANGHVSFTIWDHQVTIYHDGEIAIAPPPQVPRA